MVMMKSGEVVSLEDRYRSPYDKNFYIEWMEGG